MPEDQSDPLSEASQRMAQALVPLATLADVAARLLAARRDAATERDRDRAARLRQQLAADAASAAAAYTPALHPDWLARGGLADLGAAWRAAHLYAEGDPRAAEAAARVEDRLRRLHPPAMRRYDDLRAAGHSPADAMRDAARYMAGVDPTARPGDPAPRRAGLAAGVDPAAEADAAALTVRAGRDRQAAAATGGTPDNPATAGVDEHAAALPAERVLVVRADRADQTAAAVLRGQMFPRPIRAELAAAPTRPALPPGTPPAPARLPAPTRSR